MNNKVKNIIDHLIKCKNEDKEMKYQPEDILTIEDVWLLLDYITNLQEENKQLKEKIDKVIEFITEWEKYTKKKKPLEVTMLDLLYIKDILGDGNNEKN